MPPVGLAILFHGDEMPVTCHHVGRKVGASPEPGFPRPVLGPIPRITAQTMSSSPTPAGFPTTHWSLVAHAVDPAAPEAQAALADLCAAYWYPIYALIRRKGNDPDQALDLTQSYFARLIEKGTISAADPARGRFRAFLRTDCGYFLADSRDHDRAAKCGGRVSVVSIDAIDAESRYRLEPAGNVTPDRLFDRAWALTLLDSVFSRLRSEYEATGKVALFDRLRGVLSGDWDSPSYPVIAAELGTTADAVESASRRLRRRYREALRAAITTTLENPADLDDEIRNLFTALSR